jgi:hypothetical protein
VGGHDQPQHGVAEELEALVRLATRVLGTPGPVRQRELEELEVTERAAQSLGEAPEGVGVQDDQPNRPTT